MNTLVKRLALGAAGLVAVGAMFTATLPANAHTPDVRGVAHCKDNGTYTVTWTYSATNVPKNEQADVKVISTTKGDLNTRPGYGVYAGNQIILSAWAEHRNNWPGSQIHEGNWSDQFSTVGIPGDSRTVTVGVQSDWKDGYSKEAYGTVTLPGTCGEPSPSPTPTPSHTPTPSVTPTPTPSDTPTPTPSETPSPSDTPTPTPTPEETPSVTPTPTPETPSPTPSQTPSVTPTPTPSDTPSPSDTPTPSQTPTPSTTPSGSPSVTPSPSTPTPSTSVTPTPSQPGSSTPSVPPTPTTTTSTSTPTLPPSKNSDSPSTPPTTKSGTTPPTNDVGGPLAGTGAGVGLGAATFAAGVLLGAGATLLWTRRKQPPKRG